MMLDPLQRAAICDRCEHRKGRVCRFDGLSIAAHVGGRECPCGLFGLAAVPAVPAVKTGPLQVLLVAPALHNPGGIERWLVGMTRYIPEVSGGQVQVSAVIIRHPANADPDMQTELKRYTQLVLYDDQPATRAIVKKLSVAADVVLASGINVTVQSGVGVVESLVAGATCPIVFCSHSCCAYSEVLAKVALESGFVRYWTSVGHVARGVFPDAVADRVVTVENGAEIERCVPVRGREWQRAEWGLREDQIAIGYVGRLHHEKRVTALSEALACLPDQFVGLAFGRGIHEDEIKATAQRQCGDRLRFMGCVNHLGDVLSGLDCWLLASPAEGFCLARVEAQLAGVPIVSTPTGEIPRLERESGPLSWQIPIGATGAQMAEVIQQSQANRFQTRQLVERARALAWQRYTAPAMAGRWVDYFRRIVELC